MAVTSKRCACHACVLDDISEIEELLAEDLMARDPDFKLSLKHPAEKAFMLLSMLEHRITRSNKLYYRPDEDDDFKVRPKECFRGSEDRLSLAEMMRSRSPRRPSDEQITAHLGVLPDDLPAVLDATIELDAEWQKLLDAMSGFYTPELSFADGA